jgi:hypothetical protein
MIILPSVFAVARFGIVDLARRDLADHNGASIYVAFRSSWHSDSLMLHAQR